jgi:hypothetical protein
MSSLNAEDSLKAASSASSVTNLKATNDKLNAAPAQVQPLKATNDALKAPSSGAQSFPLKASSNDRKLNGPKSALKSQSEGMMNNLKGGGAAQTNKLMSALKSSSGNKLKGGSAYCDPYDIYCSSYDVYDYYNSYDNYGYDSYDSYCDPYDPYCDYYESYGYYKRR